MLPEQARVALAIYQMARMAVGARRIDVMRTFLQRGAMLAAIGVAIGLIAATALSGAIRSLLYGASARDPIAFGAAVVMMIALLASLVPAWKASKTDPLTASVTAEQSRASSLAALNPNVALRDE